MGQGNLFLPCPERNRKVSGYLVDTLFPSREVHLIAGPSGSGKTRWLFDTLLEWELGADVLGYRSYPVPWCYIASDRSLESVQRTMLDMGLTGRFPIIPAWDEHWSWTRLYDHMQKDPAKLFIVESFATFNDGPGRGKDVKEFLQRNSDFCRRFDKTIFGVMESPKLKPFERYTNPRQRVSGVAAWAHFAETIVLVEPNELAGAEKPNRVLTVAPRNGKMIVKDLVFNQDGHLIPCPLNQLVDLAKKRPVTH